MSVREVAADFFFVTWINVLLSWPGTDLWISVVTCIVAYKQEGCVCRRFTGFRVQGVDLATLNHLHPVCWLNLFLASLPTNFSLCLTGLFFRRVLELRPCQTMSVKGLPDYHGGNCVGCWCEIFEAGCRSCHPTISQHWRNGILARCWVTTNAAALLNCAMEFVVFDHRCCECRLTVQWMWCVLLK